MNAIQILNRIDFYNDLTRSARFQRVEYDNSVKDATKILIDEIIKPGSPQYNQYDSDELFTLIKTASGAPTLDVVSVPTDYLSFLSLNATISGTSYFCRPTNYNELGPLLTDSYRAPSDTKPYYIQQNGWKVYHGTGTVSSCLLTYLKVPLSYTCGKDTQIINAGAGVLTLAATYLALEPSVQNSVSYNIGDSFVAAGSTTLTSGSVILASNTQTSELPERTHEKLCKIASEIMMGITSDYNKSAFSEKEASKS